MKIDLYRADPAGNITLLVKSPVPPAEYANIAAKLLALPQLGAEQVGFFAPPRMGGDVRLEMMGGEFCGNATRSAAFCYARERNDLGLINTEISGCSQILPVEVRKADAVLPMPLPHSIEDVRLGEKRIPFCFFEGIAHGIVFEKEPDPALMEEAKAALPHVPALGLMFYDEKERQLRPVVYVRATDSLYFESSCASGSTALSAFLSRDLPDGEYAFVLTQPGGVLKTRVLREKKRTARILLGGPVSLSEMFSLEL